jgi:hypothetical protein
MHARSEQCRAFDIVAAQSNELPRAKRFKRLDQGLPFVDTCADFAEKGPEPRRFGWGWKIDAEALRIDAVGAGFFAARFARQPGFVSSIAFGFGCGNAGCQGGFQSL